MHSGWADRTTRRRTRDGDHRLAADERPREAARPRRRGCPTRSWRSSCAWASAGRARSISRATCCPASAPSPACAAPTRTGSPRCLAWGWKYAQLRAVMELSRRALAETLAARPLFDSPQVVRDWLRLRLGHLPTRPSACCCSTRWHCLIGAVDLFRGTLTQTSVYPREVVKLALARNAAAVILAHNHPRRRRASTADEAAHARPEGTPSAWSTMRVLSIVSWCRRTVIRYHSPNAAA